MQKEGEGIKWFTQKKWGKRSPFKINMDKIVIFMPCKKKKNQFLMLEEMKEKKGKIYWRVISTFRMAFRICSSMKAVKALQKIIKIKIFRTLGFNQKLASIKETFLSRKICEL